MLYEMQLDLLLFVTSAAISVIAAVGALVVMLPLRLANIAICDAVLLSTLSLVGIPFATGTSAVISLSS